MNVLVLEDEGDVLLWLTVALPMTNRDLLIRGFRRFTEITDQDMDWADVAVLDWHLAYDKMNGGEVAEVLQEKNPDIKIVILSAGLVDTDQPWTILRKPIRTEDLIRELDR